MNPSPAPSPAPLPTPSSTRPPLGHPLSGASRVHFIVGDPIAQVKSPAGVSESFHQRGHNAYCIPAHVKPEELASWVRGVSAMHNADGIIVTVPHKFAAFAHCASSSEQAAFLGAVNTLRRRGDGQWHGDMFDGLGFVQASRLQGCEPRGLRALLVGAGGAGTAIAHAAVLAGVSELAIHDEDTERRNHLVQRLNALNRCPVKAGSPQPADFDWIINASPAGMRSGDALPFDLSALSALMHVGCVITQPAITPLITAARSLGCASTTTGADMFACVRDLMVDFLLEPQA
jgi:shikimate dehydrogenase